MYFKDTEPRFNYFTMYCLTEWIKSITSGTSWSTTGWHVCSAIDWNRCHHVCVYVLVCVWWQTANLIAKHSKLWSKRFCMFVHQQGVTDSTSAQSRGFKPPPDWLVGCFNVVLGWTCPLFHSSMHTDTLLLPKDLLLKTTQAALTSCPAWPSTATCHPIRFFFFKKENLNQGCEVPADITGRHALCKAVATKGRTIQVFEDF